MSTIERLSIQGIRSFGANADDTQTIRFTSPITLILGENGCGKTTIIECLKYALTGECPPGSDRGKNFIHDPKIFSLSDALGQIKLEVRNIQGARLSICRSMKVGMKRGKSSFETLDATLNYLDDGRTRGGDSISKRCVDVDQAMTQFMGVSKAIINNVLFCHQEDSNWPLDEPKKLKEKFDAIFGITEYNKALDRLIKMRKEETAALKIKEADLRFAEHLKQEMEEKSLSLQSYRQKALSIDDQCRKCDAEIKPVEERLQKIFNVEREVGKYQAQKIELQTKKKNCEDQMENLRRNIKNPFAGSLEELDADISSFHQRMSEQQIEKEQAEHKLNALNKQTNDLVKRRNDADKRHVLLIEQSEKEKNCKLKRNEMIKGLCEKLKITVTVNLMKESRNLIELLQDVHNELENQQSQIAKTIHQHDEEDKSRQTIIDQLRVEITKLKESVATLKKQMQAYERELQQNEKKIFDVEKAAQQLKEITKQLKETEVAYESALAKFNQNKFKDKIQNDKDQIKDMEEQFRQVDERLTFLNSISKLTAEISLKEKEMAKREQEVRRVKSKHSDNFGKVFNRDEHIEANFKRHLQTSYEKLKTQVKDYTNKMNELKLKEQTFELKRKSLKEEIQKGKKELEDNKEVIYEKCHDTPYEELLTKSKALLNGYQLELGAQRSAEALYKKYLQQIEKESKPYCPLCNKGMSSDEASKLSSDLTDEIQHLPQNIQKSEMLLKTEQKKYENLLHLKPILEKVTLLEKDLPGKEKQLKDIQRQLTDLANESENFQMLLAEPTFTMDLASSMMGDMSLLDEALKDVIRLKAEINSLKAKLPEGSEQENQSIDDLQNEKTTLLDKLREMRKELDLNEKHYERQMESLNKFIETKNNLASKKIKLQEGVQSLPSLEARQKEIHELSKTTASEIEENQSKVAPLNDKLIAAIKDKDKLKESNRSTINEMQKKLDTLKRIEHDIHKYHKDVKEYEKLNLQQELETVDKDLSNFGQQIQQHTERINQIVEKLDKIKVELVAQETLERDLKDNRELILLGDKCKNFANDYKKLKEQLGRFDFGNMTKEKTELNEQRERVTIRKGELQGQRGEVNHQIKNLERELNEPKFRDSLLNYRRNYYEVALSRNLCDDLGQHRVALEWALVQFHTEKMQEINRLIREYWRMIYRGNDIDYIQIQTADDPETKKDASAANRRRNYNYRVVQSKNSSVIEMRGRCSAGQRVLASLIIRMALAETFSSNCGVLALDEPTTNLDRSNILSLCDALNRVVEERQAQSNFMLLIITHDEEFISTLGKIDCYNRVSRNDECKSIVRRVQVA
ncbi:DNA repair protein RAD50 [Glossina fuscipes]|uniref:DNA repair protein RAD50 n=1 Tax=Glossina fuscipes TaxID=7396 RepID=A0A9C6E4S1_9MUSC|nr:DNA repair protein RAD50 [Glossina fuscipes]XP_037901412.1 DNA repair protein RAD50 [Glossina fuscipes]XP_037901413.1 DNA repair protein RAD50 [Glossina fuscipes]XP_037901414.1 DNA repair protein RAD50 [Glossina fuscipes]XP_037901416.1 DNA repair protein RAD50 [Glossina fuscipes]XP_037901417.1 DNA repair protein RAD50 [Glossina fuscipes]